LAAASALAACQDMVTDDGHGNVPFRIHSSEHNFAKASDNNLTFLSKTPTGYIYGERGYPDKFSVIHTDENGRFISSTKFDKEALVDPDSLEATFDLVADSLLLNWLIYPGYFSFSDAQVEADPGVDFSIEIRFGPGKKQKAHRFTGLSGADGSEARGDYEYHDYVEVPFEVWDVTNRRQLMVSFRDQANDGDYQLLRFYYPDPVDGHASLEYIFAHDLLYDPAGPDNDLSAGHLDAPRSIWCAPLLSASYSGEWSPQTFPATTLRIQMEYTPLKFSLDEVMSAVHNEETATIWLLSNGYFKSGQRLSNLVALNENLTLRTMTTSKLSSTYFFFGGSRLWNTDDDGTVSIVRDFTDDYAVRVTKYNSAGVLQYSTAQHGNDGYFVEAFGSYFVILDYNQVLRFDSQGLHPENVSGVPTYALSDLIDCNSGLVGIKFNSGAAELVQLNSDFDISGIKLFSPMGTLANQFSSYDGSSVNLFFNSERLLFAGTTRASEYPQPREMHPQFFVGQTIIGSGVGETTSIKYKTHDLGFPIQQNKSYFNKDGSAAHVVVLQSTEKSTDVLFFRTDASFNIVKD
jgi:hypothetical protein